jgi:hypothetical protein
VKVEVEVEVEIEVGVGVGVDCRDGAAERRRFEGRNTERRMS